MAQSGSICRLMPVLRRGHCGPLPPRPPSPNSSFPERGVWGERANSVTHVPQSLARFRAGMFALVDDDYSIDQNVGNAFRIMVGIVERRGILHLVGIKEHDVSPIAFAQLAAIFEMERIRR